jgi:hypothetical protein
MDDVESHSWRDVGAARGLASTDPEMQRPIEAASRLPAAHDLHTFGRHFLLVKLSRNL